ncbi:MAG: hypothetical protein K0Q94_121 [Paenibacillus sp.]|jgi:hypothetical protein|uniref:DUF6115 domain-containing protein n=1 Tax=Paenibacillus sp. GCM10012303 TaxID=3317340 RepID=UPI0029E9F94E|nr:hypothetical protein [Paenibacillus sp.]
MDPWLYIVLLGLVLIVYAKLVPKKEPAAKQTNVMKEIEDTMELFSAELEEENKQLLGLVSGMKQEHEAHTATLLGRIEALEQQNKAVNEQLSILLDQRMRKEPVPAAAGAEAPVLDALPVAAPLAQQAEEPAVQPEPVPASIRDRYPDVFRLYEQGKSTEYIAKKLEMNKGEVMLIIQLAKQEDQSRV